MSDIRIVCTYDAKPFAEALTRLLEAEQHNVVVTIGRQALIELENARTERAAVLLIWSQDARSQTYMIEWGNRIEGWRLIEIARTQDHGRTNRKAPVVDFTAWRGERGGRAWDTLSDRLKQVARTLDPPKPVSKPAVAAMLMLAIAAMFGAVTERNRIHAPSHTPDEPRMDVASTSGVGNERGGPTIAIEPGSADEIHVRHFATAPMLNASANVSLVHLEDTVDTRLRNETLLEMLSDLNPLRGRPAPATVAADTADEPPVQSTQ